MLLALSIVGFVCASAIAKHIAKHAMIELATIAPGGIQDCNCIIDPGGNLWVLFFGSLFSKGCSGAPAHKSFLWVLFSGITLHERSPRVNRRIVWGEASGRIDRVMNVPEMK